MQRRNLSLLEQLVAIPSAAPHEGAIIHFLKEMFSKQDYALEEVSITPSRSNLLITKGKAKTYPLFYGHVDTVPAINLQGWKSDPYAVTKVEDKLYGLGVYDMKGGIAAFLTAITQTDTPVKILLCVDEEEISEGAWTVVRQRKDFFSDVTLIISAEPNFDLGLHGVTTSRTGRCLFTATVSGVSAHIAKFKEGKDAVKQSLFPLLSLYKAQSRWYKQFGTVVQVRYIHGESTGMSVMDHLECTIEAIVGVNDTIDAIQERLSELFQQEIRQKPRKTPYLTSYSIESFPYEKEIAEIIRKHTGKQMVRCHRTSVGDDNVLATLDIPVITWGPDGGNAHAVNEYLSLSSLETLTHMYKELLDRWK